MVVHYGQKLKTSEESWRWADEILNVAVSIFNTYTDHTQLEIEMLFDEESSDDGSRLYQLLEEDGDYERNLEVHLEEHDEHGTGISVSTLEMKDENYQRFMKAIGKTMHTSLYPENALTSLEE